MTDSKTATQRVVVSNFAGFPIRATNTVQGFDLVLHDPAAVVEWIAHEIQFWSTTQFRAEGQHSGPPLDVSLAYRNALEAIDPTNAADVQKHLLGAEHLMWVVGQSRFGEALIRLHHSDPNGASVLIAMMTRSLANRAETLDLDPRLAVRVGLMVAPAMLAVEDLATIASYKSEIDGALEHFGNAHKVMTDEIRRLTREVHNERSGFSKWSAEQRQELEAFFNEKETELTRLRDLYHKHIQTEAAATYWSRRASSAWRAGALSLAVFIAMVMVPLYLGYTQISALTAFIIEIGTNATGQLSLTSLVAITVPVLAYGWILRHISRLFIQSFAQADDARYREVMTMTFLGLTKDATSGVTAAERGIIMNALFRPTPPNTAEDGPPSGLLDLVKGVK